MMGSMGYERVKENDVSRYKGIEGGLHVYVTSLPESITRVLARPRRLAFHTILIPRGYDVMLSRGEMNGIADGKL